VISGSKARTAAVTAVLVVAASALGYWGLREYRERSLHAAVAALVADASARLRDALENGADARAAGRGEVARGLDTAAGEVDQRLEALHRMGASPNHVLVDAAELYLVTARELLRRQAASARYRAAFASSTLALRTLAASADRRSSAWIRQAIAANERAERDYANYRGAVDATASLLDSLAGPRERLARQVGPAALLGEALRAQAAERARAAGARAADELAEARRLASRQ
jgi:hypothetical protein